MSDEIVLIGYPVQLGAEQQEHMDGLLREFQLIALAEPASRELVPGRLLALVDLLTEAYADDVAEPDRARARAAREGRPTVDLRYPVRPETRQALQAFEQVMAEVDDFCRTDDLLALARPPQVVALHRWVVQEFVAQLEGQEPTAWRGPA